MELAIDAVGPVSSVAVSDAGRPLAEITWPSGRRHTPTLVPMIETVCRLAGIAAADLAAVFVDVGPGAYGGIRAGMAAAAAIALARDLPMVGVTRLEIEAWAHAAAVGPIVAVHEAGRAQWAAARYAGPPDAWHEVEAPALTTRRALVARLEAGPPGVLCGDVERLGEDARARLQSAGWIVGGEAANMRRAALLAEIGWRRLQAGAGVTPAALEPCYLREPAIGPQTPVVDEPLAPAPAADPAPGRTRESAEESDG